MRGRKSGPALPERLAALRDAVELGTDRLSEDQLSHARFVIEKADARLVHGTEHTVAALAGATGSGKSSVFNALCGTQVSTTGVTRPTTGEAHGSVFSAVDATPLLDWMEIRHRHLVDPIPEALDGLVLIDLPDHDSIELSNRLEMERVAELVDLLIWVTDPEKYADAALHHYLRKLAGHDDTTLVALNKIDRLDADGRVACERDLARLLSDDGLDSVSIVAVSATTGEGITDLHAVLGATVAGREAAINRLTSETIDAAEVIVEAVGDQSPGALGKSERQRLVDALADASGIPIVTSAVVSGYRRDAMATAGWPFTRWARKFRPHPLRKLHLGEGTSGRATLPEAGTMQKAAVTAALRDAADSASDGLSSPWPQLARDRIAQSDAELRDELDQAVRNSDPGSWREPLWWKAMGALQAVAALAVVVGIIWLAVLFAFAYFRLPEPPTPSLDRFEVPPLLVFGGLVLGLIFTLIVRIASAVGSKRRGRAARKRMITGVEEVADRRVVEPLAQELAVSNELRDLAKQASAR